jgi:hypothetical protein
MKIYPPPSSRVLFWSLHGVIAQLAMGLSPWRDGMISTTRKDVIMIMKKIGAHRSLLLLHLLHAFTGLIG